MLDEYKAYGKGKVNVEFIDPGSDDQTKMDLYQKGIPQLTFQVVAKDQAQTVNGYMGIAFSYGDKTEVIPAVKQDTSDLEYQITTAIKKVTAKEVATVGYVTSNQTADPQNSVKTALSALSEIYKVEQVALSDKDIPDEIKTLIIVGPKSQFSDDQLKTVNGFVARGGSLLVLLDGVTVSQNLAAQPNDTKLDQLLAKYGIVVSRDLVADERNSIASFSQGYMTFSVNYPYWLKITNDGFNHNNSTVSGLENVVLPWASSINIDESKIDRNSVSVLAFTTNQAWETKDNFNIAPSIASTPGSNVGTYNLAATINGTVTNPYLDSGTNQFKARITVIADSDFVTENFLQGNPDNLNFFLNSVDGLSLGEDLINIRAKGASSRPITQDLSDNTKALIRYGNIFGITIIVLAFGLSRYYLRRRSKFVDDI